MAARTFLSMARASMAAVALAGPAGAEVTLDGSMGISGSLAGPNYQIDQDYGRTVGTNLFHSFGNFNIDLGESATFYGQSSIANVIARVTGGGGSSIDGLLSSDIPGANLWLVNPSGVVFGPHASINVNGSFYVSTANYLKFADGTVFESGYTPALKLTTAAPEAFGFLGTNPAPVTFEGSGSPAAKAQLSDYYDSQGLVWNDMKVPEGKTFAVVGGNIEIKDGQLFGVMPVAARLQARGGRLELVSVASQGEFNPNAAKLDASAFAKAGDISLSSAVPDGAYLYASGSGGGEIAIRAGNLTLDSAYLVSHTTGNMDGRGVNIDLRGTMNVGNNQAGIYASTGGVGKGSDIDIKAHDINLANGSVFSVGTLGIAPSGAITLNASGNLTLSESSRIESKTGAFGNAAGGVIAIVAGGKLSLQSGGYIDSSTFGDGKGGDVSIKAKDLVMSDSRILSGKWDSSSGKGGDIDITADTASLGQFSLISSSTGNGSKGRGGDIHIAGGDMAITGSSAVESVTGLRGEASGGAVTLELSRNLTIKDGYPGTFSGIFSNALDGDAGKLTVRAGSLQMENGAGIGADNFASGRGADIDITVKSLSLRSDPSKSANRTLISAMPQPPAPGLNPTGAPGNIAINADTIQLSGGLSAIRTASESALDAGDVRINARTLTMDKGAGIQGSTFGAGRASDLDLRVGRLELNGGGFIDTSSAQQGSAGNIAITADSIDLRGESPSIRSGIFSSAAGTGDAGSIRLQAGDIALHGTNIRADTDQGRGGTVDLRVDNLSLSEGGTISSVTYGSGNAGNILIQGRSGGSARLVSMDKGARIEGSTFGAGRASDLDLRVGRLELNGGGVINTSSAQQGSAGNIAITADSIDLRGESPSIRSGIFSSAAGAGDAGSIRLQAGDIALHDGTSIRADTYQGRGGTVDLRVDNLSLSEGGTIRSVTFGSGNAGNISIQGRSGGSARLVSIAGVRDDVRFPLADGRVVAGEPSGIYLNTLGSGQGGVLDMRTERLEIRDGGMISAVSVFGASPSTRGGDINIQAGSVELSGGGLVSAATSGQGKAGNVNLTASGPVVISGRFDMASHPGVTNPRISNNSGINNSASFKLDARAQKLGSGGSINLKAASLSLTDGGEISVANEGSDSASVGGSINIDAGENYYSNDGHISAKTASAHGGDITLTARYMVRLVDSSISTSVAGGKGSGGNITIDPTFVILDNSQIIAQAQEGAGGNIRITADQFIASADSLVDASSRFGVNGSVMVFAPDSNIIGKVAAISAKFLDPASLFKEQCAARYAMGFSTLAVRTGTPVSSAPGEGLPLASAPPAHEGSAAVAKGACPGAGPLEE